MPLYMCNAKTYLIPEEAKEKIAKEITRIHCDVTDAPPTFVHVFFVEELQQLPQKMNGAFLFGSIRDGRTPEQKKALVDQMKQSVHMHAGISLEDIAMETLDVPASWVMEGGDILPEPGEEAEWLEAHANFGV